MGEQVSRRSFIKAAGSSLAAGPLLIAQAPPGKIYRACVIGNSKRGGYGHGLDVTFQNIPNIRVTAVADPDEKGRLAMAAKLGVQNAYADYREMLQKEKPDLVSHGPRWVENRLEMMTAVAQAGAHLYMEKPMAESLEEADAMLAVAEKHNIKIALAHQVRPAPAAAHLKKLLAEGLIGDVLEIRTRGKEDARAGGEDLMVLGTHCMYMMRFIAGDAQWCFARVTQNGKDITADDRRAATEPLGPVAGDTIHATFAFANGVQGHFASQKNKEKGGGRFAMTIFGTKGVVTFPLSADPPIQYLADPQWYPGKPDTSWQPIPGAPSNSDPSGLKGGEASNKRIVEDLLKAVESNGQSMVSGYEGRAALEMILSIYASHLAGARLALPLKDRKHPLGTLSK